MAAAAVITLSATAVPATGAPAPLRATVSAALRAELANTPTTGYIVYLRDRADLGPAAKIANRDTRAEFVYKELVRTAERSQRALRADLDGRNVTYKSFWISNAIVVNGDLATLNSISARSDVLRIDPMGVRQLVKPTPGSARQQIQAVEWGLTNIEAPRVWNEFGVRGESIVVGNIDTGVQYNHPALVTQYRGNQGGGTFNHNHNWFDPSQICGNPSTAPCDNNGHGTHTMGTMVGDDGSANQIGVAPGARWIAAKGCESNNCSDAALLASAQWMLAPTDLAGNNPRPDLRPDIVNNSWGGPGGDLWYEDSVDAWITAGIYPMFSNGNSGPGCTTSGSPGDYPQSYSAGMYDINNVIGNLSSRGPSTIGGELKPNIAAPGVNVRSSVPTNAYANFTGTSMASPHVSGTVALIWSAAPALRGDISATRTLLDQTATDVDATGCGGTVADNNVFGEGRLNAFAAVNAAPRGAAGRAVGRVTDAATSSPIPGVRVASGTFSALTGLDGRYSLVLPAGTHTLTTSIYGYAPQSATVEILEGAAATQDFALVALPLVTVSGQVTDGSGKAWALYARIDVAGRPGGPIFTNPVNGRYSFQIAASTTYQFTTTAKYPGYQTVVQDVVIGAGNKVHNIAVPVDAAACTARSYVPGFGAPVLTETFDTTSTPAGWSVVNRTPSGGWVFNDPGARGNLTGGGGGFAIIDSDDIGPGLTQDTDLITPPIDMSAMAAPHIRFNSDYRAFPNSTADIDVSVDGGTMWTNVWHQTTVSRRGPTVETVALTPGAGHASVLVRFRYIGTFAWWWEVDRVEVVNKTCDPIPGGLLVGFVTDRNTDLGLVGAKVASDAQPIDTATTVATPDDPNIGDGFYSLVSSLLGERSFTATKSPYQPLSKLQTVVDNATRGLNFPLRAGRLTVTPTSVTGFVPMGESRSTTVTIRNTGTAPAEVELLERAGSFEILGMQGAPLSMTTIPGGASKGKAGATSNSASLPGVQVDPAWTPIRNLPNALFDNAAATFEGKVYSVGGNSATTERLAFVYDRDTDTWTRLPDLPHARNKPQAVFVGGLLYVFGGWSLTGPPEPTVDVFDPAAGTWSTLGATNPKPRAGAGAGLANGEIYLVGGCVDTACTTSNDLVVFNPTTNEFRAGAPYPQMGAWASCGGVSGQVYCAGGVDVTSARNGFSYNPSADAWTPIADLPLDLWGSAHASASGLLVIMGGVTNGFATITNRTVGYDPASNTWADLPNAGFARYRGAGGCGVFKVAGSPGGTTAGAESEMLGGLDQCDEVSEVGWLSANPATFTLNPGQSRNVTVTLTATAAAGVLQPGEYTAQFGIRSNTPYPVPNIDVTMNVLPPPTWGKIFGTVLGQPCSGTPMGIPAFIRINLVANPDIGFSVRADNQGRYAIWLPRGRYEMIVAKDGWVPQVRRTRVDAGFTNQQDFMLAPFTPCP